VTPAVTVYIPCHDYVAFVDRAIRSVLDQVYADWELIVVDDGSTDGSREAIEKYDGNERIRVLRNETPLGLRAVANRCIDDARGEFVLRLDADDRLHPSCLELLTRAAQADPEVAIVFSDYYYIDENDNVIGVECLPNAGSGYAATTFPPHGACSLIRRSVLEEIGRYDDTIRRQDGHEVWLKLLRSSWRYQHVPLPLFYYRQHGTSLSSDVTRLLEDRAAIKRKLAAALTPSERVVAIVPVKNTYPHLPDVPFYRHGGQTLLEGALQAAAEVPGVSRVVVTTDCDRVHAYVEERFGDVRSIRRAPALCLPTTSIVDVVADAARTEGLSDDDVICLLSVHTPKRTAWHVQKALDTFFLYEVDSVVTVHEERSLVYQMGELGLAAVNPGNEGKVRLEREALYVDTGAVRVFRAGNLAAGSFLGRRIGHALMAPEDAVQIKSSRDFHVLDADPRLTPIAP
jgi:CMP-N-acetylneuraminic acid synthetase